MNLFVVTVSAPFGPAEAFATAELSSIRRLGHRVIVLPVRPRGRIVHGEFAAAADMVLTAPLVSVHVLLAVLTEILRSPRNARAAVALAVSSGSVSVRAKNLAVLPKAFWIARQARHHGATHIHAYWASTPATVAMVAAALTGIQFSFSAHAGDIDANNLLRLKSRRASFIRVISRDGRRRVEAAGVSPDAVRLVHLGVDVPAQPAPRPRIRGRLVILVPAALHPKKGHADLLVALAQVAASSPSVDVRAAFAGAGPLDADLRRRSEELGVADAVTFLGHIPHAELLAMYASGSIDVVALASVTRAGLEAEGIPVSLIEAMAHGVPVVATDSGGVVELIGDGRGILVPKGDAPALAAAFRRLALDSEVADRLGAAGRAQIQAEYDVRQTAADLMAAITTPLSASPDSP